MYKDWDRLNLCLEALNAQVNSDSTFEVIVVNNDPSELYVPSEEFFFPIKFLNEANPGSYAARNKGLSEAIGTALLFTDSDCIPASDWIFQAVNSLGNQKKQLFAGFIALFSPIENRYVRFENAFAFPNATYVSENKFGVTANLLVKKEVFDQIGGFNASLYTGGDSEFCNRAAKAGFKIEYNPMMIVKHPARISWDELQIKAIRFGGRLPKGGNSFITVLKLMGKFRIRVKDIKQIQQVKGVRLSDKIDFFLIKQQLRWVEAMESLRVFMGKKPGRK